MTLLLVGGGSGGHITPLLAVAHELKSLHPDARLVIVGEQGGKFADIARDSPDIDGSRTVLAGKFRRYHGESWPRRMLDIKTNLLNIRDAFLFGLGFIQSIFMLLRIKPDAIFIKGGFVGVPVGLAAGLLGVPYVTHDSDTLPGLANRIIAKRAKAHAVGMPSEFYSYPKDKVYYVGIPISAEYVPVDTALQGQYRRELNVPENGQVLFVTGGSLGAQRLNTAVASITEQLLRAFPSLYIIHQVGKGNTGNYDTVADDLRTRITEKDFMNDLYRYSGAADVIVTRAGATTIAEFAAQGKACVVVPNPQLTGGHQIKNAVQLHEKGAIEVVTEDQLRPGGEALLSTVTGVLVNADKRRSLSDNLSKLARPNASRDLAALLLQQAETVEQGGEKGDTQTE